jgi:TatD DNase family protein
MSEQASDDGTTLVWADAHNHLHDPRLTGYIDAAPPCIINATREDDWPDVLAAASASGHHAALGIHPWFACTATGWDDRLRSQLEINPSVGIGECGLDAKCHSSPLDTQATVFERQIHLARELNRPLTIHCVGAWGRLLEILGHLPPPARWLMHSFHGSIETARQLASMGAYFSISGRVLQPSGEKILGTFRQIPPSRILLETDAPNQVPPTPCITHALPHGLNHPCNLAAIGTAIAPLLGFTPSDFARLTHKNLRQFIGEIPTS